jgi:hypothetical protein
MSNLISPNIRYGPAVTIYEHTNEMNPNTELTIQRLCKNEVVSIPDSDDEALMLRVILVLRDENENVAVRNLTLEGGLQLSNAAGLRDALGVSTSSVKELHLRLIQADCFAIVAEGMHNLRCLTLTRYYFRGGDDSSVLRALCMVMRMSHIQELSLYRCNLGDAGAQALASQLQLQHSPVKRLILADNCRIGYEGAVALGEALHTNKCLIELNLSHNAIGAKGALALSQCLEHNASLQVLNLCGCISITFERTTMTHLQQGLSRNTTLLFLYTSHNIQDRVKLDDILCANRLRHRYLQREPRGPIPPTLLPRILDQAKGNATNHYWFVRENLPSLIASMSRV